MPSTLTDRTVLVIGRAGGIARATAHAVQAAGGRVVVAGRDTDKLDAGYPGAEVRHVDLSDEATIEALAGQLGAVDHLVCTASARARGLLADLTAEAVNRSFQTKVTGPLLLAKHFAPRMPADGSLVLFSGSSARKPTPGMLAVAATNAAVDLVARALAVELAPIRVNAISPGTVDTGAYDALGERGKADLFADRAKRNPARRIGTEADIADAVLFALTTPFLTGISLGIDGGEPLS